jgi:hypothetical protein
MIEDKELGLKLAINPEEALWNVTKEACLKRIKGYEEALIIEKGIVELCINKLMLFSQS